MNYKSLIISSMAFISAIAAYAGEDLQEGGVYRFTNVKHGFEITSPELPGNITATTDADNERRLWVVEHTADGSGFHLRDLRYGTYMTSPITSSGNWVTTFTNAPSATSMTFILTDNTLENTAIQALGYNAGQHAATAGFAHANAGGANGAPLVCWNATDDPSRWAIELIDMPESEIEAYRSAWPQPSAPIHHNRVYHLTNKQYGHGLRVSGSNAVGTAADATDKGQLWIAEEAADGFILRNYKSGGVLYSSRETSQPWTIDFTNNPEVEKAAMYVVETPKGYIFEANSDHAANETYHYGHEDGAGNLVGWATGATASFWNFSLMEEITEADIEEQRQRWPFNIEHGDLATPLSELFADGACTILAAPYSTMPLSEIQTSEAYLALPEVLQQMVIKVKTDSWDESDPTNPTIQWDSDHARKFRVQMYEPCSDCVSVSNMTCIHRYTNFNNPTGIIADEGTTLYVMVDKSAAPGSTLYLAFRNYDDTVDAINQATDGTELHEGLNIISCLDNNSFPAIYYVVTTNDGRQRTRPLTDFDDIKIHIEGGSVNGFFNAAGDALYTPDTNDDWFYYRERARFNRFPLISKHCILYFDFNDVIDTDNNHCLGLKNLLTPEEYAAGNFDLIATMNAWDDMFVAEMLLMGLMPDDVIRSEKDAGRDWYDTLEGDEIAPSDYSLYFNNRLMGITEPRGYMSATWYRTTYHVNTMRTVVMEFPTMDLWGPAHEFGHMNQAPMNIVGTTEESNNVFSNVALFTRGSSTSRADYPSVQRENFNNGATFLDHGTWGTTRMWFQLWLYYHAAGNNKKFYPRLYELLRNNPLDHSDKTHINAKDDLLHFAKMACMAAGEDLTDFFDAWGFLQPIDGRIVDDYATYTVYLSDEEINQWREEIAQMAEENGWKKNTAIIFIDDRVGETSKPSHSEFDKTKAGEMGGLNDFISGADSVEGDYEFSMNGSTVTVSGATGGVGFLIYDENGRLLGFSNEKTFDVSTEAAQKLISGEATFSVIQSDNTSAPVVDALKNASFESKLQTLKDALVKAQEYISHADFTQTRIGYLKPEMVAALQAEANSTQSLIDADEVTEDNIDTLLSSLNSELVTVETLPLTEETTIAIKDGGIYVFTNNKAQTANIWGIQASGNGQTVVPATKALIDVNEPAQQWRFTASADDSGFYISSISQDKYITIPGEDETALPLSDTPMKFVITVHEPGFISLGGDINNGHKYIHAAGTYKIVRWTDIAASQWALTLINDPEREAAQQELADKIAATRALANELGENIESIIPIELDESNYSSNAAPEGIQWRVLFDNDPDTYFHSTGETDENHHIKIQLPEPTLDEATHLILKYQTRNDASETFAPTTATIEYSSDGTDWDTAHNLTQAHLPALHNQQFESETFAVPAGTSYVRFTVNSTLHSSQMMKARAAATRPTFSVSELGLASHNIYCEPNVDTYPASNAEDITSALRQCHNSEVALNAASSTVADLTEALDAVEPHYQTLLKLKQNDITSEIDKINAAESPAAIYDLQGRRIKNASQRGIYIINGNKVVKGSAD